MTGEATGEIWTWSLMGVKGLKTYCLHYVRLFQKLKASLEQWNSNRKTSPLWPRQQKVVHTSCLLPDFLALLFGHVTVLPEADDDAEDAADSDGHAVAAQHGDLPAGVLQEVAACQATRVGGSHWQPSHEAAQDSDQRARDHAARAQPIPKHDKRNGDDCWANQDAHEQVHPAEADAECLKYQGEGNGRQRNTDDGPVLVPKQHLAVGSQGTMGRALEWRLEHVNACPLFVIINAVCAKRFYPAAADLRTRVAYFLFLLMIAWAMICYFILPYAR